MAIELTDHALDELVASYLCHLPPPVRDRTVASDPLRSALRTAVTNAYRAAPDIGIAARDFVMYLAERVAEDETGLGALQSLYTDDLFLACGCSLGDAAAIAAFDRGPLSDVSAALRRSAPPGSLVEEVRQRVAELLLVGGPERAPLIRQYAGRGKLRAWVRVIAMREANKLRSHGRREQPTATTSLFDAATAHEPETAYLKGAYAGLFKRAFHEAVDGLSIHDRLLLRQHFLDGLTIDQLAVLHQVHRATAARWLARLRQLVLHRTRQRLRAELQVDEGELDSVMRLIDTQLDASVRRLLDD